MKPVDESELPKPPKDESIRCKTGQELLNIAKVIYSSRIQEAINKTVTIDLDLCKTSPKHKKTSPIKRAQEPAENLTQDQQVINKLKEKKESSYNALLEKVVELLF